MNNKKKFTHIILGSLAILMINNASAMENTEQHNLSLESTDSECHAFLEKSQHDSQSKDCKTNTTKPKINFTHIFNAIENNDIAALESFIDLGIINECDENGTTMLHQAIFCKNAKIVQMLIKNGSKLNIQNICGMTALHIAAWYNHLPSIILLLEAGADSYIGDEDGNTALEYALANFNYEIARILIAKQSPHHYKNNKYFSYEWR